MLLRCNSQIRGALISVQTKIAAAHSINAVRAIKYTISSPRIRLDLYVCEGSATANNNFFGQCRVRNLQR